MKPALLPMLFVYIYHPDATLGMYKRVGFLNYQGERFTLEIEFKALEPTTGDILQTHYPMPTPGFWQFRFFSEESEPNNDWHQLYEDECDIHGIHKIASAILLNRQTKYN